MIKDYLLLDNTLREVVHLLNDMELRAIACDMMRDAGYKELYQKINEKFYINEAAYDFLHYYYTDPDGEIKREREREKNDNN